MTTTHTRNDGTTTPELPPLPIDKLMIGVYNLLQEGADLLQPRHLSVSAVGQQINMQFPGTQPGVQAITRWAHRFGGTVTREPHQGEDGPLIHITARFGYAGLSIKLYTFIPADPASI